MKWLIIGVGNEMRRDDGAGICVARSLVDLRGADVVENRGDTMALLQLLEERRDDPMVIVDALQAEQPPGTLIEVDPRSEALVSSFAGTSSHGFGLDGALRLARAMGTIPKGLRVFGICGGDFGSGPGLTPEVQRGCILASRTIRTLVSRTFGSAQWPL